MHLTEPPPSIAPEVFDQIGAPRELAAVIDRALEKDRNARWQTIDELANAVRAVCGDPIPTGIAQVRAASVPSPSQTTQRRAQTPTSSGAPVATVTPEGTGRVRTQWTGNLSVPEVAVGDAPKPRSKLPLILGAVLVLGGGAAIAAFVLGGKPAAPGPGSAAIGPGSAVVAQPQPQPPPPQPPPQPPVPVMVKLTLDTTPHGATVIDMTTNTALPTKTPVTTSIPGERGTRKFTVSLKGYRTELIELPLDRETVSYTEKLTRGASGGTPVVHKVDDPNLKPLTGSGAVTRPDDSGAVTTPDQTSTKPDIKPATKPDIKPDIKPDTKPVTKPDPSCDDPNVPCLKSFGSGS